MSTQNAMNSASIVQPRRNVGLGFWFQWTLATAIGWALGVTVFAFVAARVSSQVLVGILLLSLGMIVGGTFGGLVAAFLGFTQGLLLRQHGYSILTFALASFGGGFIGGGLSAVGVFVALVAVLLRLIPPSIELFVILLLGSGILTGFVIGYVQGNLLESKRLTKSKWAGISATAWAGGCAISAILGQVFFDDSNWLIFLPVLPNTSAIILATVCGLVIGTITGYPLMRALQQSPIQNPKSEIQYESTSSRVG